MSDDIEEAVHQLLQADPVITGLVGTRGYASALPQGVSLPAYTFEEISSDSEHDLQAAAGVCHTRIQINCYADRRRDANALRSAIRTSLLPFRGTASTGQFISGVTVAGRYGRYESPPSGQRLGRYCQIIDFLISHSESVP